MPATDAIVIGHSCLSLRVQRCSSQGQSDLSGSCSQVGPAFLLCPEQVLSLASTQALSPPEVLHRWPQRATFCKCVEETFCLLVMSEGKVSSAGERTQQYVLQ